MSAKATTAEATTQKPTMTEQLTSVLTTMANKGEEAKHFTLRMIERIHKDMMYFKVTAPDKWRESDAQIPLSTGRTRREHMERKTFYHGAGASLPEFLAALENAHAALDGDKEDLITVEQQQAVLAQRQANRRNNFTGNNRPYTTRPAAPAGFDERPF